MKISNKQLTPFFSGAMTAAIVIGATVFLTGAKDGPVKAQFDEITVGRINIVEPDGTKRSSPGLLSKGKKYQDQTVPVLPE